MKAVVQRVASASVSIEGRTVASIDAGLLVLAALESADTDDDLRWTADKLIHLRVFPDEHGRMNRSLLDARGGLLLVPNFTVAGDCRKGRRPSFDAAMKPPLAQHMFERFADLLRQLAPSVHTGRFGAMMHVHLINDGPVTLLLDSRA